MPQPTKMKIHALCSAQGTACAETALAGDDYNPENRSLVESRIDAVDSDAPVPGTWSDVSENEAIREMFEDHAAEK